jgi:hypothetical protein
MTAFEPIPINCHCANQCPQLANAFRTRTEQECALKVAFGTFAKAMMPCLSSSLIARGPEARYADANKFIEEDAAVRVASAFWHGFKVTLGLCQHRCGIIPHVIA